MVERALAAVRATGERPSVAGPPEVVGAGDTWVVRMPLRYGEEVYHYVGILELDGGRSVEAYTAPASFSQQRLWMLDRMDPGRAAYAVLSGAVPPSALLAVTFTARAAGELRSRLAGLGVGGVFGLAVSLIAETVPDSATRLTRAPETGFP